MNKKIALIFTEKDNVATIFANDVNSGLLIEARDKKGGSREITVLSDIPYGHKLAVCNIEAGDKIYKYGEEIGVATVSIKLGEHVHVHNLNSMRGRGDLQNNGGV